MQIRLILGLKLLNTKTNEIVPSFTEFQTINGIYIKNCDLEIVNLKPYEF